MDTTTGSLYDCCTQTLNGDERLVHRLCMYILKFELFCVNFGNFCAANQLVIVPYK